MDRSSAEPLSSARSPVWSNALVVGVFVASGAAGLIYQVVWAHQLVLVFGNTTEAVGTIVTAFMAGLGLGGLAGGLLAPRLRRPLLLYAVVEAAVGCCALLVPLGFQLIDGAYASVYDTASTAELTLIRLALSLAIVTPVTFLMGLTLPLLTRHMVTSMRSAGAHMAKLYAANTFGAMLGTLASAFVLIELIGLSSTTHVAVGLNLLAALLAGTIALRRAVPAVAVVSGAAAEPPAADHSRLRRLLYAATFVSGFVALAAEVLWTRMLAEGTGSTIYIFAVILAIYLLGIALGGAIYRIAGRPRLDTPRVLAVAFLGIAVSTVVTVPWGSMWWPTTNVLRAVMLLPATTCMGYAFPLTARLLARTPAHTSRSIGVLYAWNTVGSLLGSLVAAFVLAASIGTNASLLVLGAADAAVAIALLVPGGTG
ncbi:MAG: fused MFS/spermidine synthase, partial [Candidatus Dormibacteraeota bacterium]|nr:fused MFS/spermidine synthase [Candidatus Dormibacteraeota bacterium]